MISGESMTGRAGSRGAFRAGVGAVIAAVVAMLIGVVGPGSANAIPDRKSVV
jgi:hypothetical protein